MKTESQILDEIAREGQAHQKRLARLHELGERLTGNVAGAKAPLTMALSHYADGDGDSIDNVLTMATRAMAAAEPAKLIPSLIESIERQQENRSLALRRQLQAANTVADDLNHRRGVVERQAAEHGEASMDTMGRYLRFAFDQFGQTGMNEAMTAMASMGQEVRAAGPIAYLRARGEIAETTSWAA